MITESWDSRLVGLPHILWSTFSRAFFLAVIFCAVFALIELVSLLQASHGVESFALLIFAGGLSVMQTFRWLRSLRHMRVLPLTAGQLNALLVGLCTTPILCLGLVVNGSHFFLPVVFASWLAPSLLVCIGGFSCLVTSIVIRRDRIHGLILGAGMPLVPVTTLFIPENWFQFVKSPQFLLAFGVIQIALAAWMNQYSLTRRNVVYKQAWA